MNLVAITAAFELLGPIAADCLTSFNAIAGLGTRPVFPDVATTDASYNTVAAAQATWDAAISPLRVTYNANVVLQKASEDAVIALLPTRQWVKLVGLAAWGAEAIAYVSWPLISVTSLNASPFFKMNAVTSLPVHAYPSLT